MITMYSQKGCGECRKAERLFRRRGIRYRTAHVDELRVLLEETGTDRVSLPVVKLGETCLLSGKDVFRHIDTIERVASGAARVNKEEE